MLHIRSRDEAVAAPLPPDVRDCILGRVDEFERAVAKLGGRWDPETDGHFSLLSVDEASLPLSAMGWERRLEELEFAAVRWHPVAGLWEAIHITGNSWAWTVFVEDGPDLPPALLSLFVRVAREEEETAPTRRSSP